MSPTELTALWAYADRCGDMRLCNGARKALQGDAEAMTYCLGQVRIMAEFGMVWR